MTQNIEQRTEAAVIKYESASNVVEKIANTDGDVETGSGIKKSFPKISREWDENSSNLQGKWAGDAAALTQDWKDERDALSIKALPVLPWLPGETEINLNQQRRFTDGHTYLPKVVPAVMNSEPDANWIAYTADKSDVLSDVFGSKPVDLVNGLAISPIHNVYPKLSAFGRIFELGNNTEVYSVKSFTESVQGWCVITLTDDSIVIASPADIDSKFKRVDKVYSRNFKSLIDLKSGISSDGQLVDFTQMVGQKVIWRGYYVESDGGYNWGIIKEGNVFGDDGSKIRLSSGIYVEANITRKVNVKKFGVQCSLDAVIDTTSRLQTALTFLEHSSIPSGTFYVSEELNLLSDRKISFEKKAVIKQANQANLANIFRGHNLSNLTFSGVSVDLNKENQNDYKDGQEPNLGRAIFLTSCSDIKVDKFTINQNFGSSLFFIDSENIKIEQSHFFDKVGHFTGYPIYVVRSKHVKISGCTFEGTRQFGHKSSSYGVYAKDGISDVTVDNCHFKRYQCLLDGSENSSSPIKRGDSLKITNCTFTDPMADTTIRYCFIGLMANNIVRGSGDFGLSVGDSEHVTVDANIVENSNTVGIGIRKSPNCIVTNNIVRDPCTNFKNVPLIESQRCGIYVVGDSRRTIIQNNSVTDFRTSPNKMFHAIRVEDYAAGVKGDDHSWAIIGGNICYGSKSGIDIYADGVDNVLLNTNYRGDDRYTSVSLGSHPNHIPKSGDLRRDDIRQKPLYYDGVSWRKLPKIVDVPLSSSSPGKEGDMAYNSKHVYFCISEGMWRRAVLEEF